MIKFRIVRLQLEPKSCKHFFLYFVPVYDLLPSRSIWGRFIGQLRESHERDISSASKGGMLSHLYKGKADKLLLKCNSVLEYPLTSDKPFQKISAMRVSHSIAVQSNASIPPLETKPFLPVEFSQFRLIPYQFCILVPLKTATDKVIPVSIPVAPPLPSQ